VGGVLPSGTVTFAAGEASQTISVAIRGDAEVEGDEQLRINLSNATNGTIVDSIGVATVLNDDVPLPTLSVANGANASEGDAGTTSFSFVVTRSGDLAAASSAAYAVAATGGVDAADFAGGVLPSGTVSFAANEATATIVVDVSGDTDFESDETIILDLSGPVGATIADGRGVATILNDDAAPLPVLEIGDAVAQTEGDSGTTTFTFTVTRTGDLSQASSAAFAVTGDVDAADVAGGVLPSGTVNFAANEATATIAVEIAGDTDVEADEELRVVLSNPTNAVIGDERGVSTVLNDDVPPPVVSIAGAAAQAEGDAGDLTTFTFGLTRTGDLSQAGSVDFVVSGTISANDLQGGVLPSGTVTFLANEATATVDVVVAGDADLEPDETIRIDLSNPQGVAVAGGTAFATVLNDDAPPPLPVVAIADGTDGAEGDAGTTAFTFEVTRTGDLSQASSATFAVTGGTVDAADFAGGVLPSGTVSFTVGEASTTVTLQVQGDTDIEADETIEITLRDVVGATLGDAVAGVTILNDDAPPPPVLSVADAGTVAEGDAGTTALTFEVTRTGDLSSASAADWVVSGDVDGFDFAGGVLPSGQVVFAANEDTAAIVLQVQGDTDVEPDEGVTLTLSGAQGATLGDAVGVGTIGNDDVAGGPNLIVGTTGSDFLQGTSGADRIEARGGFADQLLGGAGPDTFVFGDTAGQRDVMTVLDFDASVDLLDLGGQTVASSFSFFGTSYLLLGGGEGDTVILQGVDDLGFLAS
jgi:hypothetical protein